MGANTELPTDAEVLSHSSSTEQLLRQVLDSLPAGVLVLDQQGVITNSNDLVWVILGVKAVDVLGQDVGSFFGEQGLDGLVPPVLATLTDGQSHSRIRQQDLPWYLSTHSLRDQVGELAGVLVCFWDARESQELELAVIKAERLAIMGQLCAGALHEIRNPLAVLSGRLQLLEKQLAGSYHAENCQVMLDTLDRVNRIISDFLRLGKPSLPRRLCCQVDQLILSVIKLLHGEFQRYGVKLEIYLDDDLPVLYLDQEQVYQVFLNILNNSLQVMPNGGEIKISANANLATGYLQLIVQDTGPGIPGELLEQVFEPFITTKESGTGLGLYLSRAIIQNHGGEMKIENNRDRGCRVVINLPLLQTKSKTTV